MKTMNTSIERVDALMILSDKLYPLIDVEIDGQTRARQMLRLGIAATADALKIGTSRFAGDYLHSLLIGELAAGGLHINDEVYDMFPSYRQVAEALPRISKAPYIDPRLDELACQYADVLRATISQDGSLESDASHAVHLASLALPYAAEYYPHLEQSKIAMYCLLHDLVEAYVGDVPSLGVSDETMEKKHAAEQAALRKLEKQFGEEHPRLVALVLDYENLIDEEACFVKTFDKLDPGFTHFYSAGKQLTDFHDIKSAYDFFATVDQTTKRMKKYSANFSNIMRDRDELTQRVADHVDWPA